MPGIHINKERFNQNLLNEQIIDALGDRTSGISTHGTQITVHLTDEANSEDMLIAAQTVENHDHTDQSPDQLYKTEQDERIELARALYTNRLLSPDTSTINIIARINWLQDELESKL